MNKKPVPGKGKEKEKMRGMWRGRGRRVQQRDTSKRKRMNEGRLSGRESPLKDCNGDLRGELYFDIIFQIRK